MSFYMIQIFTFIIRIGYQASITVFFILLARALFNRIRIPRRYSCFLWWIPFLRLAVPIQPKSAFSLLPSPADPASIGLTIENQPVIYIDSGKIDSIINTSTSVVQSKGVSLSEFELTSSEVSLFIFAVIWGIGMLSFFGYGIYSVIQLKRRLRISIQESERIYLADHIPTAFVMGICPTKIYLPSDLPYDRKEYVICHEQQHIKRKDPIIKIIFFFLTCLYWIHPLIWVAYYLANKDIEFACDETVIQSKPFSYRQRYAAALLEESIHCKKRFTIPLAFSKESPKRRIQYILSYKKPSFFVIVFGIVGILVLSAALLTDPVIEATEQEEEVIEQTSSDPVVKVLTEQKAYLINQQIEQVNQNNSVDVIKEQVGDLTNHTKEQAEEGESTFELKTPQIDLAAAIGSDIPRLYYVDKNQIIFGGNFWVFVYSKKEQAIIRGIDLEAIGCSAIPEERYCEIEVSSDGATLYFHPIYISSNGTKTRVHPARSIEWLIYSVSDHTLTSEKNYHVNQEFLYNGITEEGKKATYRVRGEEKTCELSYADTIGSLLWSEDHKNYSYFFSQED